MTALPERIPTMSTAMIYQGSFSDLPRAGVNGDLLYNTDDNKIYVFSDSRWVSVGNMVAESNIVDDLTEVLDKYPDSSIAKDIRTYLELQRRRIYA